ncbi:hypothetical protein B5M09_003592 [Aphanomyces astaci]|uniref:Uncharacterized protein n=1 Tax=Aphanomyces astaci TaxID=112090 RepID=A0A3R7YQC6_APHAT|nr:hypothetical protein B5M09_003592 [Aphanomyces astaci]
MMELIVSDTRQFDDDTETDALRLMQTQPSFPHLLVLPPQDDPTCVMNRFEHFAKDLTTILPADVHGTMLPIPPLHSLRHAWVGILRCLRSIQYTVESGFNDASYQSKCDILLPPLALAYLSLRTFLHLDNNALDQADKATQVDAVEKWQVFQRLCGLGSDLQMLAGPQALMKRDKRVAVNGTVCLLLRVISCGFFLVF